MGRRQVCVESARINLQPNSAISACSLALGQVATSTNQALLTLSFVFCKMHATCPTRVCERLLCQLSSILQDLINGSCSHYTSIYAASFVTLCDSVGVTEYVCLLYQWYIGHGKLWYKGTHWKCMAFSLLPKKTQLLNFLKNSIWFLGFVFFNCLFKIISIF